MEIQIIERYKDFSLPFDAVPMVRDLLRYIPPAELAGLQSIILTNESAQSREDRRRHSHSRRKKVRRAECCGFYAHVWKGEHAYIQLHMDVIFNKLIDPKNPPLGLRRRLRRFLCIPYDCRWHIARVLYHEIGHHVQERIRPENGEPETFAERYGWGKTFALLKYKWHLLLLSILGQMLFPIKKVNQMRAAYSSSKRAKK